MSAPSGPSHSAPGASIVLQEGLEKYGNESSGCSIPGATGRENGYLFMFPSGSLVFWDVPLGTRRKIFDEASGLSGNDPIVPFNEFDHEFEITANESTFFKNDKIHVKDLSNKEELLALSFGLAQSTKLQVYEEAIDKLVEETQVLPNQLAIHGRIYESNRTLKQRMGTLLSARYSVSLLSDILDTPDFFWEHPNLEVLHKQCRSEIGMNKRVNLLSRRMDIIKDSLDLINTEISDTSSRRVEWYIVSLIAVEIAIEVGKLFFDR
uniref:DUF155 domain-containing protein n=1 Tax=Rhodosorus marinus TaxID=101924 RepID=A0A7S2ZNR8_9RHOD|mmetsp:Transcript_23647/g.93343  ORF Transcript_23647/g.93343 Transcript_23647/m.93343 type:complete len:265 (+) Transcript_23647:675-1469(+)